jgi:hypothetical protein
MGSTIRVQPRRRLLPASLPSRFLDV